MSLTPTTKPSRVVIEEVSPDVLDDTCFVKRVVGETVEVLAAIFADGHQEISADLLYRKSGKPQWAVAPMRLLGNDRWAAEFSCNEMGFCEFTLVAWINAFKSWQHDLVKRKEAGQQLSVEFAIGKQLLGKTLKDCSKKDRSLLQAFLDRIEEEENPYELFLDDALSAMMRRYRDKETQVSYERKITVRVQRKKALFSAWYELFPRSFGGFRGVLKELVRIKNLGFDVLYFPPIHPIGTINRKGKNNGLQASKTAPGSPWAIGSQEGGHDALHPSLGKMEDFLEVVRQAKECGIEVALDLALQCSPDHPWVREHPEWFLFRQDGSLQFAENPPKKYEDIVPLHFDTPSWQPLWEEILRIVLFWVDKGVQIFRVDNPHTKPFAFWKWLIDAVQEVNPAVIFLAEAFTRPRVMYRLAKVGFDQSYTYFTWRNTKWEITDYLKELTSSPLKDYFRPNFWPNTPDILPEYLQHGRRPAFIIRFILAATLSSNYGIYGPAFERYCSEGLPGKEEYQDSEKYEVKRWALDEENTLEEIIALVNRLRNEKAAFQTTWNLLFCEISNNALIGYVKLDNFLIVVNLDPYQTQAGQLEIPLERLGIGEDQPFLAHDHLSNKKYMWTGRWQYIELNPHQMPAHLFEIHAKPHKEKDFDYFM